MERVHQNIQQRSLYLRLLGRIVPILLIGYLIGGLFAAFLLQLDGQEDYEEEVQLELIELAEQIDASLALPIADIRLLTNSIALSSYIDGRGQADFAANVLTGLVDNNPVEYLSARLYGMDGRQFVAVYTDENGVRVIETDPVMTDIIEDPVFNTISITTTPDVAFVGYFNAPTDAVPGGSLPIYVPIAASGNRNLALGVLELTLSMERLTNLLQASLDDPHAPQDGRRIALVSNANQVLFSDGADFDDASLEGYLSENQGDLLTRFVNPTELVSAQTLLDELGADTPWRVVIQDDYFALLADTNALTLQFIGLYLVLGVVVAVALNSLIRPLLRTLDELVEQAESDELGLLGHDHSGDEITRIARSISRLNQEINTLEKTVTISRSRHEDHLQTVKRLSGEIAELESVAVMVPEALQFICVELNLDHAVLYLLDDLGVNAVHVHTHSLLVDPQPEPERIALKDNTLVSRALNEQRPMVMTLVGDHRENFAQPGIRAQIVVPMFIGERLVGALDLQTLKFDTIPREDIPAYGLLANQLAATIEHSRRLDESRERIEQLDELGQQLTAAAWKDDDTVQSGYHVAYDLMNVKPVTNDDILTNTHAISAPIEVRGTPIGSLVAAGDEAQPFSEGDAMILRAVANRVALAIENARLFQQTQSTLAETSILYELSRYLNASDTLDEIVQSIVTSVMPDANGGQVWLFDDYHAANGPGWMTVMGDLTLDDRAENNENLVGFRLHLPDHQFLKHLNQDRVTLVNDARDDQRLDTGLKIYFRRVMARSVVVIPFSVRGLWRGLIFISFGEIRRFSEREGRIYTALIDQAGVAIDNRLLLKQTEESLTLQENLYAASRQINQSQNDQDLVYAAVATAEDPELNFSLGILEGELDENDWSRNVRVVARSREGQVYETSSLQTLHIREDSPLHRREPSILMDDTPGNENVPEDIKWMRRQGYRFTAVFPLYSANQPIALFYIHSTKPYDLSQNEYEVYRAMTGQMSTQLEIRRQVERTERALDETRRLYLASSAIVGAQDLQQVYQMGTEHLALPFLTLAAQEDSLVSIAVLVGAADSGVFTPYLTCAFSWSTDGGSHEMEPGDILQSSEHPYGQLSGDAGGVVYVPDLINAPAEHNPIINYPEFYNRMVEQEFRSLLLEPIQMQDRWFGVLVCRSNAEDGFDEQYRRFVGAVVDQVAIAIDNRRLFEEAQLEAERAQSEAKQAMALAEAAQLASRVGDDFEQNLSDVFIRVSEVAGFDRWLLLLYDDDRQESMSAVVYQLPGFDDEEQPEFDMFNGTPVADAALANRTLMVNDLTAYPSFADKGEHHRMTLAAFFGKHLAVPITVGDRVLGSLFMGRSLETSDLDEREERLVGTLAVQVAVALENRRLFQRAQNEEERLRFILSTLPAGVLVLEPKSLKPILFNDQAEAYLGQEINSTIPFDASHYDLYRTGTNLFYPYEEMPIIVAREEDRLAFADDFAVIGDHKQIDLQFNAAPIHDASGNISAIVAAFQDITALRSMENTLQENLRQTVTLYEAQLQFSEAEKLEDVLDAMMMQMALFQPDEVWLVHRREEDGLLVLDTAMAQAPDDLTPFADLFQEEQSVFINEMNTADMSEVTRNALSDRDMELFISVPIRTRQRGTGWLILMATEADRISEDQDTVLTQVCDAAATAIDNRVLMTKQQRTLQEIGALYSATTTISRTRDLNQLSVVLEGALATLQPEFFGSYIDELAGVDDADLNLFGKAPANTGDFDFQSILKPYQVPPDGIFIEDLHALDDPNALESDLLTVNGLRSVSLLNLRVKDNAGGRLIVGYSTPHRFTEDEKRYLNTLIDSASVVVDNIQLFEQTQSTLEETTVLYQASRALTDVNDTDDIIDVVVNFLIGPHVTQVFMAQLNARSWDVPGATVEITSAWNAEEDSGLSLHGLTLTADQFPAWRLLSSPDVISIEDVYEDESIDDLERIGIESLDARSLVVLPLQVSNRAIGAIWLASNEPYPHTERDVRLYQAFAEQASLSMEASFLLQQTERRARQLETSAEVSRSAGSILDLEVLLPRLVDLIRDAFAYDHTQIFLLDEREDWAILRASTGEAGELLLKAQHKLRKGSDSVIGRVTEEGIPQIALDTADADVVHQPNPYLPLTRSEMALPLMVQGRVVGALDVQSNQPNAFNEEDIAVLRTLAAQISVAIDNANLYKSTQAQAERMGFLFNVTRRAAAAETLEETLETVIGMLHGTFNALTSTVYLRRSYVDDRTGNTTYTMRATATAGSDHPISEIEEIRFDAENNRISTTIHEGTPQIIDDTAQAEDYLSIASEARSAIIVPLSAGNATIGIVVMEDGATYAYDDDALRLLEALAGSISAIVQSSQLLEQLQSTNEQLRELDKVKSDFLANMSHELRTPLNSIIGFSRVMLKGIDGPLTEMQEQDLTTIFNSGQHLLMLINDVLDQAKIAAGKLEIKPDYFEVKPLIEAVKSIAVGLLKDKSVDLVVELAPNLPQAYGDELRIRQVLINLVSNSSKFTEEGHVAIRVYPWENPNTGIRMMRFDIEDTGIGIAEKDLPLLFEAFRQVDSSLTRTAGGTGLGLPIAKSLVEMQGGKMTVVSEVHVGSVFSVTLPLAPIEVEAEGDDDDDAATGTSTMEMVAEPGSYDNEDTHVTITDATPLSRPDNMPKIELKSITQTNTMAMLPPKREVLLIEDDKKMVDQFRRILQREGFEVTTADHKAYAEAMASNMRPTLLVMDVNFADGEGWNILERLKDRDDTFDIPIVIVTLDQDSERVYRLGAHTFLQRPFMPEQLVAAVLAAEQESNTDRILIIDDQPESIRLLTEALNASGSYRIFSAQNGREGISLVARRRPDLIILDLRMPDMDGFEVLQELRANPETSSIPVMVVTGDINLNSDEQNILQNIHVLPKTAISETDFEQFVTDVQGHLRQNGAG